MATRQGVTMVLLAGVVLLLVVVFAPPPVEAITFTDAGFFSEPVATLAPFKPVGVTFAPDGRIFIWQRDGVIRIVKNGALLPTPFLNFSSKVNTYTDHGFLGVALDPNFAANGWVYVFYTYETTGNPNDTTPKTGHLSRVTADPTNPDVMLANSEIILLGTLDVPPCSQYPVGADCFPTDSYTHSVGSLRFLPDGTLFASHGDGATADFADVLALRAQSLDSYAGKLLRIKPDGTAPQAPLTVNPFNDGSNSIRSKVWAYGIRNSFRLGLHPTTGLPFMGDVGWNTWEEINQGAPGANYGWPCWEGNAQQPGYQASFPTQCQSVTSAVVTFPLYTYNHAVGSAVIGGAFFTGAQYPAAYAGNFFFADYPAGWMKRLVFDGSGNLQSVVDFASAIGTIDGGPVAIELGPDGLLYYVVFTTGEVARIRHTSGSGSNFPPFAAAAASPPNGYSPLQVGFSSAGSSDPEGGALTYLWEFGDGATATAPNPFHTYTAAGVTTFPVRLTVTDNHGATATASLNVVVGSTPPVATIDLPASGASFTVGQTATYHGSATDPDDGPLPSSALHWTVLLHHNTHIHPFIDTTGSGGSFPVANHDPSGTFSYEFRLTATDSSGLTNTKSITVPVNPPPPSAPVLLYGMNEGSGTTVTDTSGNNHTGSLVNGPVWVAGQATYGQALSFDGVDDAVSVANPAAFNFGTADFTIELWAKRNVLGGAQRHLFSKCASTLWQSGCKEFYFNPSNQLTFGSYATGDTVSSTIADTNWHHVAVTFTDSTNTLKLYVDGALVTTATKALEADGAGHVVTLGNLPGNDTFSGVLDEVRIYNRALTLTEIQADRTTPITPPDTTPPSTVTGLTAAAISPTQINLSWTAATDNVGVTGYRVERCQGAGCGNFAQIATPAGTTFGDTGLIAATNYSYRVKAVDAATNVSVSYSTVATATTQASSGDTIRPTDPTGLTATAASSSQINLAWTASTDSGGSGLAGYHVERCQGAGCSTFAQIATPITNSVSDPGLTAGTSYSYRVRAIDGAGNLSLNYSNIASATPQVVTNLVTAYGMNEGSGTTLADASGTGHTGTLVNGPAWVAGQATYGQALSFDGVNDAVTVANPTGFNFGTADFTIELWAKRNALGGTERHLFSKCDSTLWQSGCKELYFNASNQLTFGSFATGDTVSSTIADTNWHHVAVTFTDSTNTLQIYVDGALVTTATKALETDNPAHVVTVGNLRSSHAFSGVLDEVRLYGRVLTLAEIQTDRATPITTNLTTAYGMNEGSGTTLADASGTGHTGTLVNGPAWVAGQATYGQALSFDGVNDAVTVANPTGFNFGTADFTIELWAKRTVLGGTQRHLFSKCDSTLWQSGCKEFYFNPNNQLTFGSYATGDTLSSTIADTNWHHIAVTFTDSTNTLQIYVDGALVTTATKALEADSASHVVMVGNLKGNNTFSGLLDEVRIYSRVLTLAQIQADMATPITSPGSDTTPPSTVTGLTTTAVSSSQINLSWTAATDNVGVTGYRVERCQGAGCTTFAQIATPTGTTFGNTGLTAATSYSYRVKAVDAANNVSVNYSNVASATTQAAPPDTTPPSTVTGFTATAVSATQINLAWTAATDNVGVTGYRVERCQGAGCSTFVQIATPTGTTFSNTGLTAATSYSYRVKAVDAANNVSVNYSNVASATTQAAPPDTTPPSTVTGFTATAVSATQINLSWTAATDNVGVTGYRLERCQGAGCTTFVQIATPTGTTFSNTGLIAATSYSYRVKAVDAASNVSVNYSNVASATTLAAADTTPPTAPGTLTATAASRSRINLTWAAATDNVGVTGYRVERCQGATCTNFVQVGTPTGTSFGDTGLTRSTTYRYRVRASDAAGNLGPYSGISTATTKK